MGAPKITDKRWTIDLEKEYKNLITVTTQADTALIPTAIRSYLLSILLLHIPVVLGILELSRNTV